MAYRNYATAVSHIVDTTGQGDFTTIAAALTAASSGQTIFIRPGTYTENPTLKAGVNLAAYACDSTTPNVIINGKCTFTGAGTVSISGVELQTNSDFALAVTGSSASVVYLLNCKILGSNNTPISFTSSSSSASIFILNSIVNLSTTGIAYLSQTSAGLLKAEFSSFANNGGSSTASTASAGSLQFRWCEIAAPITTSSTNSLEITHCQFDTSSTNSTCLTIGGSGTNNVMNSILKSGTASAISVSQTVTVELCNIISSNANTITGSGTVNFGTIEQGSSPGAINAGTNTSLQTNMGSLVLNTALTVANGGTGRATLTNHGVLVGAGTSAITQLAVGGNSTVLQGSSGADPAFTATPTLTSITLGSGTALSTYQQNTWTPALAFGGATTGLSYTTQAGQYTQIGNIVYFQFVINLSSKVSATGNATITGWPVAFGSTSSRGTIVIPYMAALTLTANYTSAIISPENSSSIGDIFQVGSGQAVANVTNTNFANNTIISGTGFYFTT